MEKNPDASSNPSSVCEKIFKAISVYPVRSATPAIEGSRSIVGSTPAIERSRPIVGSTLAIERSRSMVGCKQFEVPSKKKDKNLVSVNLERSITIQIGGEGPTFQSDKPQMSIHQTIKKREPAVMDKDAVQNSNTKPKAEKTQSTKMVAEKENDNVAVQHVSVTDKPNPGEEIESGKRYIDILATKVEPKPKKPILSVHDRLKSKELVARPTKVVLEQIHSEGANNTQKNGQGTKTHVSVQDREKIQNNIDKDSPVNTFEDDQLKDRKGGQSTKSILYTNSNDKFSDYINRAKLKIRATSDVGTANDTPRVDSMNEKVNDFIHRAKFKIRTSSSNIGGSWPFK